MLGSSGRRSLVSQQKVSRFELSANGKHWRPSAMRKPGEVPVPVLSASGTGGWASLQLLRLEAFGYFFDA